MKRKLEQEFPKPDPFDFSNFEDFLNALQEYKRMMKDQGIDISKTQERKNKKFMV